MLLDLEGTDIGSITMAVVDNMVLTDQIKPSQKWPVTRALLVKHRFVPLVIAIGNGFVDCVSCLQPHVGATSIQAKSKRISAKSAESDGNVQCFIRR